MLDLHSDEWIWNQQACQSISGQRSRKAITASCEDDFQPVPCRIGDTRTTPNAHTTRAPLTLLSCRRLGLRGLCCTCETLLCCLDLSLELGELVLEMGDERLAAASARV